MALRAKNPAHLVEGELLRGECRPCLGNDVAASTLDALVSAIEWKVPVVIKVSRRAECFLPVTLFTDARKSTGVNILVAGDAFLSNSEESLLARQLGKATQMKRFFGLLVVAIVAIQRSVFPLQSKLHVGVLKQFRSLALPGDAVHELKVPPEMLVVAAHAFDFLFLLQKVVVIS